MNEFERIKLGDVGQIITGKTPLTKVPSYYDGTIHFVSPADLNGCDKNILYTAKTISNSGLQSIKGCILPKGTICVSCIGNLGYVGITTMECASNQQINSIIVDESRYDLDYIYYAIKHLWRYFKSQENQSTTISIINKSTFSNIEIYSPSLETQRKIASILSTLDDKIAVNRKICENLEAQAQALFKHWFIDFAPFKDGKFVESELGMIPEGWRVGTLGEIVELKKISVKPLVGIVYKHYSIPAFDNSKNPSNDEGSSIKSSKFGISNNAVLLSKLNPTTKRIWYVGDVSENSVSSTEFLPFYAKNSHYTPFVYCYLSNNKIYREIANGAKGTTNSHQRIDANSILSRTLAFSEEVIRDFCKCTLPMMEKNLQAEQESSRLAALRDALLPKLMSGQIKL